MTQVPRAEVGQAEVWVTSPNDGEIRQVTVGLHCPVHCLLQAFDPLIPRWPEPGPQELAPPRQLVIRLHAHPASLLGRWPLPDAVIWATIWLTRRRDRPNRLAMARWLSGCPAATDAA